LGGTVKVEAEEDLMLRKAHDILTVSLFGFFKVAFFLSLFSLLYLSAFLLLKSERIFHTEKVKSLGILSSLISGTQDRELFYKTQGVEVDFKDSVEEMSIFRYILKFSNQISHSDALKLAKLIKKECKNYKLNPFLILAMIQVESEFSPKAVSPQGAIGLMQVMPETAEFVAGELRVSINGSESLYNPFINVRLGIYYLSFLINRFKSVEWALFAYNFGPNSFLNTEGLEKESPAYVRKVLSFKELLEAGTTLKESF
jgi:transglycosylase-like protein with SLT domain